MQGDLEAMNVPWRERSLPELRLRGEHASPNVFLNFVVLRAEGAREFACEVQSESVAVRSRSQHSSRSAANDSLSRSASILTEPLNDLLASQTGLTRQCRFYGYAPSI